ncbi:hypothetical protein BDZ97DRAFT_2076700 [Flammula alnicola]|nr:hypothetical protein BDZ97DRAFT_2076700 [Flammula alnicola]
MTPSTPSYSRTLRCERLSPYPSTPTSRTVVRKQQQYFIGPLSNADPELKGLARTPATKVNDKRIERALHIFAPPEPQKQESHCQHRRRDAIVFMCVGNGDPLNAGRWIQKCNLCDSRRVAVYWISEPLDPSFITDNRELQLWFKIRQEIDSLKGTGRTPTLPTPPSTAQGSNTPTMQPRPFPNIPPLDSSLSPPSSPTPAAPQASTSRIQEQRRIAQSSDLERGGPKLNRDLGMLLMFWKEDFVPPLNETIYPRFDSRVRLSDFKIELGLVGLEQTDQLEVFHPGDGHIRDVESEFGTSWSLAGPSSVTSANPEVVINDDGVVDLDHHYVPPLFRTSSTLEGLPKKFYLVDATLLLDISARFGQQQPTPPVLIRFGRQHPTPPVPSNLPYARPAPFNHHTTTTPLQRTHDDNNRGSMLAAPGTYTMHLAYTPLTHILPSPTVDVSHQRPTPPRAAKPPPPAPHRNMHHPNRNLPIEEPADDDDDDEHHQRNPTPLPSPSLHDSCLPQPPNRGVRIPRPR